MEFTVIVFIIAILIVAIWLIFRIKGLKHKLLSFFLISLILFSFFSFNFVFSGKDISIKSISDLGNIVKTYFVWLGGIFNNLKVITTQAIKMNWQGNKTT